ncbi:MULTISPECIES: hypothetical protein [Kitasatospora]
MGTPSASPAAAAAGLRAALGDWFGPQHPVAPVRAGLGG